MRVGGAATPGAAMICFLKALTKDPPGLVSKMKKENPGGTRGGPPRDPLGDPPRDTLGDPPGGPLRGPPKEHPWGHRGVSLWPSWGPPGPLVTDCCFGEFPSTNK